MLVGNLQLPAAVDRIGLEFVEGFDLRIPGAVAQVLCSNVPKGVALDYRMDAVGFFLLLLGGIDSYTIIGENESTGILVCCRLGIGKNTVCADLGLTVLPFFPHTVVDIPWKEQTLPWVLPARQAHSATV